MSAKIPFENLPRDIQLNYISEAFHALVKDNQVPYGIATGDTGVWDEYDPAIELAERNYYDEE